MELLAVRWRDIDLDAGGLAVVANSVRVTKRVRVLVKMTSPEPIRGEPKTQRGRRVVEMPSLAVGTARSPR